MIKFFQKEEEEQIIAAIVEAENQTSGEIRVHLEDNCKGDILTAAKRTFRKLKMHKTDARNGILIFLAPERKEFAILGDEGINNLVGDNFWAEERDLMQRNFKEGKFTQGICLAIAEIGEKLKIHFPYQSDDVNELPDDISYG